MKFVCVCVCGSGGLCEGADGLFVNVFDMLTKKLKLKK